MPAEDKLVSVAMASYNGERFIREQVASVFAQTYKNIELVITDDASTDDTVKIIQELQLTYPAIRLFALQQNAGVSNTFQHSIKNCNGEFIALADQDDVWEPEKIKALMDNIGDADAIYADAILTDSAGNSMHRNFKSLMNLQSYYTGGPFLLHNCVPGHAILMKREFAKKILPFPNTMMFDRWISFCAASRNGIKYLDRPLVRYRQHENNVVGVGKRKNKERLTKQERFEEKITMLRSMEQAPITDKKTREMLSEMIRLFHRRPSIRRSAFFFRYFDDILVIKKKSGFRKFLYCLKMFFKPNY